VRFFLDTNVWLSAVVFQGLCAELLIELDLRGHRWITSDLVRSEVHTVLQRKFRRHAAAVERFDALWACAARVPDVAEPADDDDARLVAAARAAEADAFITGDQRVLSWGSQGGMLLLSPRQGWDRMVMASPLSPNPLPRHQ
jgi:putative PIN family toxin of toxin-antitoxin system